MPTVRFVPGAALAYLALAVAYAWPLPLSLSSGIGHDAVDPLLNTWILDWTARHPPWTAGWWDAPAFAPMPGALALSEHLLGLWPLSAPLLALGVAPPVVYNLLLIASVACSALAAAALVAHLTGSRAAGIVAGCLYGFAPYRLGQLAHLQILAAWWGPVALLALHRQAETGGWRWALVFAGGWLLLSLTSGYHLVFFTVVAAVAGAWLFLRRDRIARAWPVVIATACAALVLVPLLLGYQRVHVREGLTRQPGEIDEYSADAAHLWQAPALSKAWGGPANDNEETSLFPGVALIAGLVLALVVLRRDDDGAHAVRADAAGLTAPGRDAPRPTAARWSPAFVAAGLAIVPLLLASAAAWAPGRYEVAGLHFSLTRPAKSLTIAWVLALLAALLSPPGRRVLQRRTPLALYVLLGVLAWILTLGPRARIGGVTVLYHAPYAWLMVVPGGLAMRVAPRFWPWAVLALAVVVGFGVAALRRRSPRAGLAVAGALSVVAVADGWPREMPVAPLPAPAPASAMRLAPAARWLELPLGYADRDMAAMWRASPLGRRVVNGYSGYVPTHYRILARALHDREAGLLQVLAEPTGLLAAVDGRFPDAEALAALAAADGGVLAAEEGGWRVFLVAPRAPAPPFGGRRVRPSRVTGGDGVDATAAVVDDDRFSRWATPSAQRAGEFVVVQFAEPLTVAALELCQGAYPLDYPARLRVEAGTAGGPATIFDGHAGAAALRAALATPTDPCLVLPLRAERTRELRVSIVDGHPKSAWSISSLSAIVH